MIAARTQITAASEWLATFIAWAGFLFWMLSGKAKLD